MKAVHEISDNNGLVKAFQKKEKKKKATSNYVNLNKDHVEYITELISHSVSNYLNVNNQQKFRKPSNCYIKTREILFGSNIWYRKYISCDILNSHLSSICHGASNILVQFNAPI